MSTHDILMAAARGFVAPPGQQTFTITGTTNWTVPAGVTSISIVAVGAGGSCGPGQTSRSGGGGACAWVNNVPVSPGQVLTVVVGAAVSAQSGGGSSVATPFGGTVVEAGGGVLGGAGGTAFPNGGSGGTGGTRSGGNRGGGGAGGYTGNGGNGTAETLPAQSGSGGGGGGGAGGTNSSIQAGRGGGVGLLGEGASGAGATVLSGNGVAGSGGSGALYGAGGGSYTNDTTLNGAEMGGQGAVRIIWPGSQRQFPSTRTTDE